MWIQQKQLFGDGWVNILFLTLYLEIETSTQITTPFLNRINENHSIFEDTTEVGSGIVTKQSTIIQVYHDATPMMSQKSDYTTVERRTTQIIQYRVSDLRRPQI